MFDFQFFLFISIVYYTLNPVVLTSMSERQNSLDDKRSLFFQGMKEGFRLTDGVLITLKFTSVMECVDYCLKTDLCKSTNVYLINEFEISCELMSASVYTSSAAMEAASGYTVYGGKGVIYLFMHLANYFRPLND